MQDKKILNMVCIYVVVNVINTILPMLNFPDVWSKRSTNDFASDAATGNIIIQTDDSLHLLANITVKPSEAYPSRLH